MGTITVVHTKVLTLTCTTEEFFERFPLTRDYDKATLEKFALGIWRNGDKAGRHKGLFGNLVKSNDYRATVDLPNPTPRRTPKKSNTTPKRSARKPR